MSGASWDEDEQGCPPDYFTGRIDYTSRNGRQTHRYVLDGSKVEGVTTILKEGMPRPQALQRWDRTQVAKAAVSQRNYWKHMEDDEAVQHLQKQSEETLSEAANRGSTIHEYAQAFAETGELPSNVPAHLAARAAAFEEFVTLWHPRFLVVERVVFNPLHGYAGTLDAIVVLPTLGNTLLDYKTAKNAYGEIDDATDVRYALPRIDSTAVVLLGDDGCRVVPVAAGREQFQVFLGAKRLAAFSKTSRSLVGKPLAPPVD
jgi:hypothetical protein